MHRLAGFGAGNPNIVSSSARTRLFGKKNQESTLGNAHENAQGSATWSDQEKTKENNQKSDQERAQGNAQEHMFYPSHQGKYQKMFLHQA